MAKKTRCCPMCNESAAPYPENRAFPFCSPRCKLADLGNWLDERYLMTAEPAADLEAELRDDPRH